MGLIAGVVVVIGVILAIAATSESTEDARLEALNRRLVACGVSQDFVMDGIHPIGETPDGGTIFALPLPTSVSPDDVLEITVGESKDEGYVMYSYINNPIANACGGTDKWFYANLPKSGD